MKPPVICRADFHKIWSVNIKKYRGRIQCIRPLIIVIKFSFIKRTTNAHKSSIHPVLGFRQVDRISPSCWRWLFPSKIILIYITEIFEIIYIINLLNYILDSKFDIWCIRYQSKFNIYYVQKGAGLMRRIRSQKWRSWYAGSALNYAEFYDPYQNDVVALLEIAPRRFEKIGSFHSHRSRLLKALLNYIHLV